MPKRSRPGSSLTIELANGSTLTAQTPVRSGQAVRIRVVGPIAERYFDVCPICGNPDTEEEHVPPRSIGGRVMTRTCTPCNHGLGSRVEAELVDWHDDAVTLPAFSGDAVPGRRRASRIAVRATPNGEFVLLMDGDADPAVRDLLLSGRVDLTAFEPDRNRVRLGLLKHSFLAACLLNGLLVNPYADAVRRDLIAARDAPSRRDVPRSEIALGLTVLRSNELLPVNWPVAYCVAVTEDGAEVPGVTLARKTFVSWSWGPVGETEVPQPVQASLTVGTPIEGVVRDVSSK
jgi:HNH endonuclease